MFDNSNASEPGVELEITTTNFTTKQKRSKQLEEIIRTSSNESFKSISDEGDRERKGFVTPPPQDFIVSKPLPQRTPPDSPLSKNSAPSCKSAESSSNPSFSPGQVWSSPQSSSNSSKSESPHSSSKSPSLSSPLNVFPLDSKGEDYFWDNEEDNTIYILIKQEGKRFANVYFGPINYTEAENLSSSCAGRPPPNIVDLREFSPDDQRQFNYDPTIETEKYFVAGYGLNDSGKNSVRLQRRRSLFDFVKNKFEKKYTFDNLRKDFFYLPEDIPEFSVTSREKHVEHPKMEEEDLKDDPDLFLCVRTKDDKLKSDDMKEESDEFNLLEEEINYPEVENKFENLDIDEIGYTKNERERDQILSQMTMMMEEIEKAGEDRQIYLQAELGSLSRDLECIEEKIASQLNHSSFEDSHYSSSLRRNKTFGTHGSQDGDYTGSLKDQDEWCKDKKCQLKRLHKMFSHGCTTVKTRKGNRHRPSLRNNSDSSSRKIIVDLADISKSDLDEISRRNSDEIYNKNILSIFRKKEVWSETELSKLIQCMDDTRIDGTDKLEGKGLERRCKSAPTIGKSVSWKDEMDKDEEDKQYYLKRQDEELQALANAVNSGRLDVTSPTGAALRARSPSTGSSCETSSIASLSNSETDYSETSSLTESRPGTPLPRKKDFEVSLVEDEITIGDPKELCRRKCLICYSTKEKIEVDLFPYCLKIGSDGNGNCWEPKAKPKSQKYGNGKYCCRAAKSASQKYCCRVGCNKDRCGRKHIVSSNRLPARTKICKKDNCNSGCNEAHYPEEVRRRFSTMCLHRILDSQTDEETEYGKVHFLDWKMYFPQYGEFNTRLSFFDYIHETLSKWMLENKSLWTKIQDGVIKHHDKEDLDIRDTKNLVRNITIWSNCAYNDGKIVNDEYKIWSGSYRGNHYCEDIVRLFGAKAEVEGHHVFESKTGKKILSHKSRGCKDGSECVFFINCYKGFHTIREFIKSTPKSSLECFQNEYNLDSAWTIDSPSQVKLNVNKVPALQRGLKYMLKLRKNTFVIVRLISIEGSPIQNDSDYTFERVDGREFKKEDLKCRPELLSINKLVSEPKLSIDSAFNGDGLDYTLDEKGRLNIEKNVDEHVYFRDSNIFMKDKKYILRIFIRLGEEDVFYDELVGLFKITTNVNTSKRQHYFEIEGVFPKPPYEVTRVEIFQNFPIGTKIQNETFQLQIPIVEKDFIDTSFICSQDTKVGMIQERHKTYLELCRLIKEYNQHVDIWHDSSKTDFKEMKSTMDNIKSLYLGKAILHGKQLGVEGNASNSQSDSQEVDLSANYPAAFPSLSGKTEHPSELQLPSETTQRPAKLQLPSETTQNQSNPQLEDGSKLENSRKPSWADMTRMSEENKGLTDKTEDDSIQFMNQRIHSALAKKKGRGKKVEFKVGKRVSPTSLENSTESNTGKVSTVAKSPVKKVSTGTASPARKVSTVTASPARKVSAGSASPARKVSAGSASPGRKVSSSAKTSTRKVKSKSSNSKKVSGEK